MIVYIIVEYDSRMLLYDFMYIIDKLYEVSRSFIIKGCFFRLDDSSSYSFLNYYSCLCFCVFYNFNYGF